MIRAIRGICIALFILSAAAYGGITIYEDYTADTAGPTITMESSEVTAGVAEGDEAILSGVTARDARDGDVTDSLIVESMSNFITDGMREATIAAFDEAGNVSRAVLQVTYSDYTSPILSLSGPLEAPVSDTTALLDVITVTDCLDGDLTDQVQVVFDTTNQSVEAGDIAMHIQVSNSAGDTLDVPVTVRFYDTSAEANAPKLTLTDYLVYLDKGSSFDAYDYLDTLTVGRYAYNWSSSRKQMRPEDSSLDTIPASDLSISDNVDTGTAGTYEVTYTYKDEDGDEGVTRLVVIVED